MAYPPELIQQIRDASDIVGVVQQWVPLKKAGGNYKGLCPFHNEKGPSFNVHPQKQIFHCFGCGEGGDVFSFVQKISKVGFGEAIKILAERAGIALPEDRRDDGQREQEEARRKELEHLGQLLDLASVWFRRHLEESEEAAPARAYAEKRGLDAATREKFQLGWAPADGRALQAAATKKGFDEAALDKAGLMSKGERGIYSRFRARLMFPIQDPKGRLAGFGGRIVGEGEPKYLNSGEGPLFNKSSLLYPWPHAKEALAKLREALIVEGYLDAIACHQFGFAQAVATLGTALTEEHARLLKRYVSRVILLFDTDQAGLRAARRAGETLMGTGLEIRVARLQGVKDPDELLRAQGPPALQAALDAAVPLMEFCVAVGLEQAKLAGGLTPQSRSAVLADTYPMIVKLGSAVEAEAELLKAAQTLGVSAEAAAEDYAAFKKGGARRAAAAANSPEAVEKAVSEAIRKVSGRAPEGLALTEGAILCLIQGSAELFQLTKEELPEPKFCSPLLQSAVELLWKTQSGSAMELADDGRDDYHEAESLLQVLNFKYEPVAGDLKPLEYLKDLFNVRQERMMKSERDRLMLELRGAESDALPIDEIKKIQIQMQNLSKEISAIERQRRERHLALNEEEA